MDEDDVQPEAGAAGEPAEGEFHIEAADDHLHRYVGSDPVAGVIELIWNALDAEATQVAVKVERTASGAVDRVHVVDDGHGFGAGEIKPLFSRLGGSWKMTAEARRTRNGKRELHGRKGQGRWRALSIGDFATWESVTPGEGGNFRSTLRMRSDSLSKGQWAGPVATLDAPGTHVTVTAGMAEPNVLLRSESKSKLRTVFALYLTKYPELRVLYDGDLLDPTSLQTTTEVVELEAGTETGSATLTIIEWSTPVDRVLCLCDENGSTLESILAGVHAPGMNFTAYIAWRGFREHEDKLALADLGSPEVSAVVEEAKEYIREYSRAKRQAAHRTTIDDWQDEEVYPFKEVSDDPVEQANQALFNYIAVTAKEAINSIGDLTAKKLSMQTIKLALEADPGSLEKVIGEVLNLPQEKLEEFRELLEKTSLTAVVAAARMVAGRLELLRGLRELLFNPSLKSSVLEREHMQAIIGDSPWLFGEEYATHISDQYLTTLLKDHIQAMGRDNLIGERVLTEDGEHRRIDFMFGRVMELRENRRDNLVVEIKRPTVVAKRQEFDQIEDYASLVADDERFDQTTNSWCFVLVVNDIHPKWLKRVRQSGKPVGLFQDPDDGPKVWVKKWSEVIGDCEHRLKFIRNELEYDPSGDQAMDFLRESYPDYLPEGLRRHN